MSRLISLVYGHVANVPVSSIARLIGNHFSGPDRAIAPVSYVFVCFCVSPDNNC